MKKRVAIFILIVTIAVLVALVTKPEIKPEKPNRLQRFIGWTLEKPDEEKPTNADRLADWLNKEE